MIHLPGLGGVGPMNESFARSEIEKFGIRGPYLLCPTHLCSHKNVGPLIAAQAILRSKGRKISLVFTGSGTEKVRGSATPWGVSLDVGGSRMYSGWVMSRISKSTVSSNVPRLS